MKAANETRDVVNGRMNLSPDRINILAIILVFATLGSGEVTHEFDYSLRRPLLPIKIHHEGFEAVLTSESRLI